MVITDTMIPHQDISKGKVGGIKRARMFALHVLKKKHRLIF